MGCISRSSLCKNYSKAIVDPTEISHRFYLFCLTVPTDCDSIWNIGTSQRALIQKLTLYVVRYSVNIGEVLYFPFSNANYGKMLVFYVVTLEYT